MRKVRKSMSGMAIVLVVIAIFIFAGIQRASYEGKIDEQIKSMGGEVISVEKRGFFTGLGPFTVVGKGRTVYRIEYQIGNSTKEGWVRFGSILGPDWRL
jgi:hypothetical protein